MKYTDFLIEVKTPWMKHDDGYQRKIIRYNCIPGEIIDKPIFACRYLNEMGNKEETSPTNNNEGLLVHAIDINTEEEIKEPTELISCLIDFTAYQWNYEK